MRLTSVLAALLVLALGCNQKSETVTTTDTTGTVQTKTTTVTAGSALSVFFGFAMMPL